MHYGILMDRRDVPVYVAGSEAKNKEVEEVTRETRECYIRGWFSCMAIIIDWCEIASAHPDLSQPYAGSI